MAHAWRTGLTGLSKILMVLPIGVPRQPRIDDGQLALSPPLAPRTFFRINDLPTEPATEIQELKTLGSNHFKTTVAVFPLAAKAPSHNFAGVCGTKA